MKSWFYRKFLKWLTYYRHADQHVRTINKIRYVNYQECTRSLADALNFCNKNAFGSIWPGGLPIPKSPVALSTTMEYTLCFGKSQWNTLSSPTRRQNLSYQTNQFSFEGIHCFHGNDRSHSLIWETSQHQTQFHKDQIQ